MEAAAAGLRAEASCCMLDGGGGGAPPSCRACPQCKGRGPPSPNSICSSLPDALTTFDGHLFYVFPLLSLCLLLASALFSPSLPSFLFTSQVMGKQRDSGTLLVPFSNTGILTSVKLPPSTMALVVQVLCTSEGPSSFLSYHSVASLEPTEDRKLRAGTRTC